MNYTIHKLAPSEDFASGYLPKNVRYPYIDLLSRAWINKKYVISPLHEGVPASEKEIALYYKLIKLNNL